MRKSLLLKSSFKIKAEKVTILRILVTTYWKKKIPYFKVNFEKIAVFWYERKTWICNLPVCSIAKYYPAPLQTYDLHQKCARKSKNIHICHALLLYTYFYDFVHRMLLGRKKNILPKMKFLTVRQQNSWFIAFLISVMTKFKIQIFKSRYQFFQMRWEKYNQDMTSFFP